MDFRSAKELIALCEKENISISEAMLRREVFVIGIDRQTAVEQMHQTYKIMKESAYTSIETSVKTIGRLIGGEAKKVRVHGENYKPVCGSILSKAIAYAMGMLEINASMGLIVAAPTAGSCGVIPGVFIALQEEFGFSDSEMVEALFHTAAIGYIFMRNATVSGAKAGCQAEVGSASAMAASAVAELMGAKPASCLDAASSALSNLLGLVCDPIAGLVEVPCQKRNAMGVANALVCAEIALSGVKEIIPFDEILAAMYQVGISMPSELRETAKGGTAATPTGCALCSHIIEDSDR